MIDHLNVDILKFGNEEAKETLMKKLINTVEKVYKNEKIYSLFTSADQLNLFNKMMCNLSLQIETKEKAQLIQQLINIVGEVYNNATIDLTKINLDDFNIMINNLSDKIRKSENEVTAKLKEQLMQELINIVGGVYNNETIDQVKKLELFKPMISHLSDQILLDNKVDKVPLMKELLNTVVEVYKNATINQVKKLELFKPMISHLTY
jgi:hypothetical protein